MANEKVVEFADRRTREERKVIRVLADVLKAIKENRLNYIIMCTSTKDPAKPKKSATKIGMDYWQFDKLNEGELQLMIDFLQEGSDNLIRQYFTSPA